MSKFLINIVEDQHNILTFDVIIGMIQLHINFMNNLQNYEFAKLYNYICNLIDAEKLQNPDAREACEAVKSHMGEIAQMLPETGKHELTDTMNEKAHKRTEYLISVRKQVEGLKLSYSNEKRAAAVVLTNWLEKQGKKLYRPFLTKQSRLVENLIFERQQHTEIDEAITFLGFDLDLEEIYDLTKDINTNFMKRLKENSARTKKSKLIRKAAYRDLKRLTGILNAYSERDENKKKDIIYEEYSRELKNLLTQFHTQLKSRITKKKNKKEIAALLEELISKNKQEPQKMLPRGVNDELKNTPSIALETNKAEMNPRNIENNSTTNTKNAPLNNNDKNMGEKDGDGKLRVES